MDYYIWSDHALQRLAQRFPYIKLEQANRILNANTTRLPDRKQRSRIRVQCPILKYQGKDTETTYLLSKEDMCFVIKNDKYIASVFQLH